MNLGDLLKQRWQRLWDALDKDSLDGLYVAGKGHILGYGPFHYLSGYHMVLRYGAALIMPQQEPVLFVPTTAEQFLVKERSGIRDVRCTNNPGRLALQIMRETGGPSFRLGVNDPEGYLTIGDYRDLSATRDTEAIVIATDLFQQVKAIKFPDEIAGMDRSYVIADEGFRTFMDNVRPGRTGWELAAEVEKTIRSRGVADSLIFIGKGTHFLHWPDQQPLTKGDLVTFYVEIVGPEGYWVERAGIFSLGPPSADVKRLADACIEAFNSAADTLRPGASSSDVCDAVENIAERMGYTSGIWHGHGVGIDHDIPYFVAGDETVLQEDMTIALHPNFIDTGNGLGASLADCFHITADGPRRMSQFDPVLHIID